MLDSVVIVLIAIIGLIVGSFLNAVIFRLHARKSFTKGRSECPHCHHKLGPLELVPVFSWILQRGRCRRCGKSISVQYPLVELITAILFVLAYDTNPIFSYGDLLILAMIWYIFAGLIVLAVYDLRWYMLPDKVLLPLAIPALAILIAKTALTLSAWVVIGPLLAALLFGGIFYALAAASKGKWMGGGDIKLAFLMGLILGLQKTALAMFLAFVVAALVGVILIVIGRKKRTDSIPFGPFLIGATIVSYIYGSAIIEWYSITTGTNLL